VSIVRWTIGVVAVVIFGAGCTPGTAKVQFSDGGVNTIEVTHNPDGTVTENHGGDPSLVGRKEVHVNATMSAPVTLQNIVLSYWTAGNKAGSRSTEKVINQAFNPSSPAGVGTAFNIEIPDAADHDVCSGLYYMFAASYRNGTPGTFISQPRLILPTEKRLPNGSIQQAQCAQPPGPEQ
jgi:hypothetical protein